MTDEDFLGLDKVGHFVTLAQPPVIEPGTGHLLGSTTDHAVVVGEVLVLAVDLASVTLDDADVPAGGQLVGEEGSEHVLIPPVFVVGGGVVEVLC